MGLNEKDRAFLAAYRSAIDERFPGAVRRMLVFGSKARGDSRPGSDLDLLLILNPAFADRRREIRFLGHDLDPYDERLVSILAYTEDEWADRRSKVLPFPRAVEREGVLVP